MSSAAALPSAAARCAAMRREFDDAFARPATLAGDRAEDLLAIRVSGDAYALRLSEIAGLHVDLRIVPLPGGVPNLLGIAAIRGVMLPLFDLAGLLGYPPAAASRWVAVVHTPHPVGLALEHFESHMRIRESLASIEEQGDGSRARYAQDAVRSAAGLRPVLKISTLIEAIRERQP